MSRALDADAPVNQSVERAVRLLGFFWPEEPELSLAQLTQRLGTSKATTHRYTLRAAPSRPAALRPGGGRVLARAEDRRARRDGARRPAHRAHRGPDDGTARRRAERDGRALDLGRRATGGPVRVDDNTDRLVRIVVRTGARLPRDTSAQGKVFLAFGADAGELPARERAEILDARVAVNSQVVDGIRAIATPVFQGGEITAAMALVGTIASLPEDPRSPPAAPARRGGGALRRARIPRRRQEQHLMPARTWDEIPDEPVRPASPPRFRLRATSSFVQPGAGHRHRPAIRRSDRHDRGRAIYGISNKPDEVRPGYDADPAT